MNDEETTTLQPLTDDDFERLAKLLPQGDEIMKSGTSDYSLKGLYSLRKLLDDARYQLQKMLNTGIDRANKKDQPPVNTKLKRLGAAIDTALSEWASLSPLAAMRLHRETAAAGLAEDVIAVPDWLGSPEAKRRSEKAMSGLKGLLSLREAIEDELGSEWPSGNPAKYSEWQFAIYMAEIWRFAGGFIEPDYKLAAFSPFENFVREAGRTVVQKFTGQKACEKTSRLYHFDSTLPKHIKLRGEPHIAAVTSSLSRAAGVLTEEGAQLDGVELLGLYLQRLRRKHGVAPD